VKGSRGPFRAWHGKAGPWLTGTGTKCPQFPPSPCGGEHPPEGLSFPKQPAGLRSQPRSREAGTNCAGAERGTSGGGESARLETVGDGSRGNPRGETRAGGRAAERAAGRACLSRAWNRSGGAVATAARLQGYAGAER
jgi:hypothetical protein